MAPIVASRVMFFLVLASVMSVHAAEDMRSSDSREFFELLERTIPREGFVEAWYQFDESAMGPVYMGFDFKTGAWYKFFEGKVFGVDTKDECYSGKDRLDQADYDHSQPRWLYNETLEDRFPFVFLWGLARHHEFAKSITKVDPDTFEVKCELLNGLRNSRSFGPSARNRQVSITLRVDGKGRVRERENLPDDGVGRIVFQWEYPEKSECIVAVPSRWRLQVPESVWEPLHDLKCSATPDPSLFDLKRVVEYAASKKTRPGQRLREGVPVTEMILQSPIVTPKQMGSTGVVGWFDRAWIWILAIGAGLAAAGGAAWWWRSRH